MIDRVQKLKDARSEAAKEIEEYKAKKEAEYKKFESEVCLHKFIYTAVGEMKIGVDLDAKAYERGGSWAIYQRGERADRILQPLLLPSTTTTLIPPSTLITPQLPLSTTELLPNQHLPINHRRLYKETTCRYRKLHQREPRKDNQEGRRKGLAM